MADLEKAKKLALAAVLEWLEDSRPVASRSDKGSKGTRKSAQERKQREISRTAVCVGLLLCRLLKEKYPIEKEDIDTGGGQVPGLSGARIQGILKDHGIEKKYTSMGGRTTRSSTPIAKAFIEKLEKNTQLGALTKNERIRVAEAVELLLVGKVKVFLARKKLDVDIDLRKPSPVIVGEILRAAYLKKVGGAVAQHLVGAKLARRFPEKTIENYPATAPDEQLNREADFLVENAAFHVSIAPNSGHIERCAENFAQGRHPYLLVPFAAAAKAQALAEDRGMEGKVAIIPIETFVGQNIGEMSEFRSDRMKPELAAVLKEYNRRVEAAETDQSIQINIPKNLSEG